MHQIDSHVAILGARGTVGKLRPEVSGQERRLVWTRQAPRALCAVAALLFMVSRMENWGYYAALREPLRDNLA